MGVIKIYTPIFFGANQITMDLIGHSIFKHIRLELENPLTCRIVDLIRIKRQFAGVPLLAGFFVLVVIGARYR